KITLALVTGAFVMSSSVALAGVNISTVPPADGWVSVDGIYAPKDDWSNNTITISGGIVEDAFAGGYADGSDDASGNKINIGAGTFEDDIFGAYAYNGDATGNTVNITNGAFGEDAYIYGGYSYGDATGNAVTIADGTFERGIVGGESYVGNATENTVNITAGTFNGYVCGGYSEEADAAENTVTITDGTFNGDIYGGESYEGNATENTVNITAGTFNTGVFGGYSYEGDVTENTVTITDGTFNGDIYGGCSDAADATANTVAITAGTFDGDILGGCSYVGNATENTVDITAGTFGGNIVGGFSENATAAENTVNITAGTFNGYVCGGYSEEADAAENTVTITDGTFNGCIYGGESYVGNATENTVNITAGTFNGYVYGGYSEKADATGNTVTISGAADLENAQLFGGAALRRVDELSVTKAIRYEIGGAYGGSSAPNTLNIGTSEYSWANLHNTSSNNIKTIQGFDIINFEHVKWDTENPALKVERLEMSGDGTTITVNNLYVEEGDATFVANANMTLIDSTETNGNLADASSVVTIHSGIANVYAADIVMGEEIEGAAEEDVFIVLGGEDTNHENVGEGTYPPDSNEGGDTPNIPTPSRNDQVLVLGESRAAAMAFTNQGSELIELAINSLVRDQEEEKVFAAIYGNHSEYETGSHVNVNGWSGIVGIGKTTDTGLTYGAFFENGIGDYSTHNIYTDDYIRGDGEAVYNGGGFLIRKDNTNGVYTEASVRAGNLSNELEGAVRNGQSLTGYDIDTFYYGAHIGVGKLIPKGNDSLDVYGKFIYTHHNGETFDIDGTDVKFDSMDSQRLRLGLRYNSAQTKKATLYYGAAWEYEFDGDANDKVATFDLETPSLEGSTVIGELGLHYIADARWSLDVNARGYAGQRDGVSGSVQVKYSF
ncbi:MAG: autotransporter outer membrane beta-barrel domain-containing protein, partial [Selenomonadales bacterium]|nr:autotransporter outer membrane beta-barrel domain-containing protein [Selenomonadales bacterium]